VDALAGEAGTIITVELKKIYDSVVTVFLNANS
jgi:flagellin-specific chaperone FliS